MRKYKGFSLIEVIITIGILLILIAIVTPQFIGYLNRSKSTRAMMEMQSIRTSLQAYYVDWGEYPESLEALKGQSTADANKAGNFTITGIEGPIDYFERDLPQDIFWNDEQDKLYKYKSFGQRAVLWSNGPNKEGIKSEDIGITDNKITYTNRDQDDIILEI